MTKITFKLKSRYSSNVIKGTSYNTQSRSVNTLLKDGTILKRAPSEAEQEDGIIYNHTLSMREPHPDPTKSGLFIFTEEFTYLTDGEEHTIKDDNLKQRNALIKSFHKFVRNHDHVAIFNEKGVDTNPNNLHSAFELIDVTKNEISEAEKNKKIAVAGGILNKLFKEDIKSFRDFCYAYGIPMVDSFEDYKLLNMATQKMQSNPDFFFDIYENKQRDILTLIEIGLNKNIGKGAELKYALTVNGESYYLDNDLIAIGRQQLQEVLMVDVVKRRILETMVGYNVTTTKSLDSVEAPQLNLSHIEKEYTKEVLSNTFEEDNKKKIARSKCIALARIKNKEVFEEKVEELRALFRTEDFLSVQLYALEYLDDFIERNYKWEREEQNMALEDDRLNVDNDTVG